MSKLDTSKPYGTAFVGDKTYLGQDGKYFDPNTKEEVVPPVHKNADFACKFCGAIRQTPELLREHLIAAHPSLVPDLLPKPPVIVPNEVPAGTATELKPDTGKTETTAKPETVPDDAGTPAAPHDEPETTVEPVPTEADLNKLKVSELKEMAKKAKIEGFDNMGKPALVDALIKAVAEALKHAPPQADK